MTPILPLLSGLTLPAIVVGRVACSLYGKSHVTKRLEAIEIICFADTKRYAKLSADALNTSGARLEAAAALLK